MVRVALIAGVERRLGCWPRTAEPGEIYPLWGTRPPAKIIPREDWTPVDWSHFVDKVLDQDGQGACNAFASVQAVHVLRRMLGLPFVELSAGNLYGRINGGRDAGSTLVDAIRELEKRGVCTAQTVPHLEWQQHRWPKGWEEEAKKFRVQEAYDCPIFDYIASALLCGFVVNVGIMIGHNFEPDRSGWIPPRRGEAGGHAMCAVGLLRRGSEWGVKIVNSWGPSWGLDGFAIVPESYFRTPLWTDGWALRLVVDPKGEL